MYDEIATACAEARAAHRTSHLRKGSRSAPAQLDAVDVVTIGMARPRRAAPPRSAWAWARHVHDVVLPFSREVRARRMPLARKKPA